MWHPNISFSKIHTACLSAFSFIRKILVVGFWERFLKSETIIIYPHDGWLSATYKTIEQVMLCITPSDLSRHSMFWQDFCLLKEPREIGNYSTGCKSPNHTFLKINILKESSLIVIQTIPQQKALDLSFNLAPWKWAWHYQEAVTPSCPKRSQKPSVPTYTFHGKEAWVAPSW